MAKSASRESSCWGSGSGDGGGGRGTPEIEMPLCSMDIDAILPLICLESVDFTSERFPRVILTTAVVDSITTTKVMTATPNSSLVNPFFRLDLSNDCFRSRSSLSPKAPAEFTNVVSRRLLSITTMKTTQGVAIDA
jgi:hypothetical protein